MSKEKKPKRMVDIDLFTHPKMRGTSALAKALFVFLLLPNPSGINCMSIRYMRQMVDAGASDDDVVAALGQLCKVGVVRWDPDSEVVWVVKALERQAPGASPKIGVCVRDHIDSIPPSPLLTEFKVRYLAWFAKAGIEFDDLDDAPKLRLVESPESTGDRAAIPYRDGVSACRTGISDTETDTVSEPESRVSGGCGQSRQEPGRGNRSTPRPPSRDDVEPEIKHIAMLVAGVAPGSDFVSPAVERVVAGKATIEDVRAVTAEYKRRKDIGDKDLGQWRALFFERNWATTQRSYLLRSPPPARMGRVAQAASALPGAEGYWASVTRPDVDLSVETRTPEQIAEDEALVAKFFEGAAGGRR